MYLNYNKFIYNSQQHACSTFDDVADGTVRTVLERMKSQPMRQTNVRRNHTIKTLFALAKSYRTYYLFTITYYLPKNRIKQEKVKS